MVSCAEDLSRESPLYPLGHAEQSTSVKWRLLFQRMLTASLIIIEIFFSAEASTHAFACLSVFQTAFFTGLEVYGVLLDLFDDGFLLDLALEPFESLFDRLTFVDNDKCH